MTKKTYKTELFKAMDLLAKHPDTLFLGQCMEYGGTSMFWTFENVPVEKRMELPVFEEVQMGMGLGMSLKGIIPILVYPRFDFLILAMNQLVNHIDKAEEMSDGQFKPKVIIRTCVGSVDPLMPGPQHMQNYSKALKKMLTNIEVIELKNAEQIMPAYTKALNGNKSMILVEFSDLYNRDLEDKLKKAREKDDI